MKRLLTFGLIIVLAACNGNGEEGSSTDSEESISENDESDSEESGESEGAENEEVNEEESGNGSSEDSTGSTEESTTSESDDSESNESDDTSETASGSNELSVEETDAPEEVEITIDSVLSEQEGTMLEVDRAELEAALIDYIEEISDDLTDEMLYEKLIEFKGGHPDIQEAIRFFRAYSPDYMDLTDQPGGMRYEDGELTFKNNVYILLDNSSSMLEEVGGEVKMDAARSAVDNFVSTLPDGTQVSLINYGFGDEDGTDAGSCEAVEATYPLDDYDSDSFNSALNEYEPVGFTLIAAAIEEVSEIIESSEATGSHTVYIVSDGEETCDGDPVQAVMDMPEDDNVQTVLNIIGFDINDEEVQALVDITEASGGEYFSAVNPEELNHVLESERNRIAAEWVRWSNENLINITRSSNEMLSDIIVTSNDALSGNVSTNNDMLHALTSVTNEIGSDYPKAREYLDERNVIIQGFIDGQSTEATEETDEERIELREEVDQALTEMESEYSAE